MEELKSSSRKSRRMAQRRREAIEQLRQVRGAQLGSLLSDIGRYEAAVQQYEAEHMSSKARAALERIRQAVVEAQQVAVVTESQRNALPPRAATASSRATPSAPARASEPGLRRKAQAEALMR